MTHSRSARAKMIASMVLFGTLGPFVRQITVSSGELALYRAVIATLVLGVYSLLTHQKPDFRAAKRELPLLLISGVAMGLNWMLLFEAYRYTTVSVATLSYYFAPVIVTLACPLLFHEKMTGRQWLCFGMTTLGLALVTGLGDLSAGSSHLKGILFGLGAAALYASVILLNKFIKGVAGLQRTQLQFIGAIAVLIPYVACTGGVMLGGLSASGWVCLLIVGLIHTVLCYLMYFTSIRELPGHEAAILSYADPLVAVLVSVFVLGEHMTLIQIIGGALILGFTLLNELPAVPADRS